MSSNDQKRLSAARELLRLIAQTAEANLCAELWDGSIIPLGPGARTDVRIRIRSAAAFRRLILSPSLMTVWELFAAADLDIVGASPLQAADLWDHNKLLKVSRTIGWRKRVALAWQFLFGSGSTPERAPVSPTAFDDSVPMTVSAGRDDKALISFHYDVSNDFYALFLGPEMAYSCGYFTNADMTLEEAQFAKFDRICRKLHVASGDKLLDIGCGWGGLMCHAAQHYGAIVHGVTLSKEQYEYCMAKVSRLGLEDRVTLELGDYRAVEGKGRYDRIAQIEMFEHVGIDNHEAHFRTVHRLLRPRGTYIHQATTRRATPNLADFRKETSYVKVMRRYIFPGGDLDHIGMSTTNLERFGFEVHSVEGMREHYRLTLREWERRLYTNRETAERLAGADRTRLWLVYFAMFAKSFERGTTSVFQTVATRRHSGPSELPLRQVG